MAVSKQTVLNALGKFKELQDSQNNEKFVAQEAGKGLISDAELTKLGGISAGAQVNVIETVKVNGTALTVTNKGVNIDLSGKVDKVNGKQLSTEDFTTAEKTKLGGISAGAQVNVIESITIDGTTQTVTNKGVALDLSAYVKGTDVASALIYKSSVNAAANLPSSGQKVGDVYNVRTAGGTDADGTAIKAGDNVVWNGTGWDVLTGTTDLSGYVEKVTGKGLSTEDFTTALKTKLENITDETISDADVAALFT